MKLEPMYDMMPPFREYDFENEKQSPESLAEAVEKSKKLREKMEAMHIIKPQVDIWKETQ